MEQQTFKKDIIRAEAYWIHPDGLFMPVHTKHILKVIQSPEDFGLTLKEIQKIYNDKDEEIGIEAEARKEIIISLIQKGFIRIRNYRLRYSSWTVNIYSLFDEVKETLGLWAGCMLESGVSEYDAVNLDLPDRKISLTMGELYSGELSEYH